MTPERAKKLLPIITAFANGETIEARLNGQHNWSVSHSPAWNDVYDYRVKPKVPEYRLFQYIDPCENIHGLVTVCTRNTLCPDSKQGLDQRDYRVSINRGKWLTDWLPIPNYQE